MLITFNVGPGLVECGVDVMDDSNVVVLDILLVVDIVLYGW